MTKTILVVDDEPELRDMIQLRAQDMGYTIVMAENGADALAKVKAGNIDLIICDVLMPVMDGFTFYKELKKNPATAVIPVLILTARGKMEESFKVMGVDDFLAKPFDGKILMERVGKIFKITAPVTPSPSPVVTSKIVEPVLPQGDGKKVFVAGSDADTVHSIARFLGKLGCQVDMALSGQDTMLKTMKAAPSLLILDVMMEDFDSAELIKALKSTDEMQRATIVTYCFNRMSELGSEDIREISLSIDAASERCLDEGAKEYLGRFNEGPFLNALQKYI